MGNTGVLKHKIGCQERADLLAVPQSSFSTKLGDERWLKFFREAETYGSWLAIVQYNLNAR